MKKKILPTRRKNDIIIYKKRKKKKEKNGTRFHLRFKIFIYVFLHGGGEMRGEEGKFTGDSRNISENKILKKP